MTMSRICAPERRRGPPVTMSVVRPKSQEETEFIGAFASALAHATAVIAANPDLRVATGSIADLMQNSYARFRPEQHPAISKRARAWLAKSPEEQSRLFGAYAGRAP